MTSLSEHPKTVLARQRLKEIFEDRHYIIEEEVELDTVTNNIGEPIIPPYRADMLLTKQFIIELDPQTNKKRKNKGHGTKHRRTHDSWRDKNIKNQMDIDTVRLIPLDILKLTDKQILDEIDFQLRYARQQQQQTSNNSK